MKGAYYNELDPFAAAWLRELIQAGEIAPGEVDERSIVDVRPADLLGYTQCHFFAGIGGWSLALRLAGWPDDRPVWTGSCPCQPFSVAGKGEGADDARHLWPQFHRLIAECGPAVVFGEQVASAAGKLWLAAVRADLEELGYAVGGADLCAAGVGAPHLRQRLYWVADAEVGGRGQGRPDDAGCGEGTGAEGTGVGPLHAGERGGVAHPLSERGRGGPAGVQDASDAGQPSEVGGPGRPGFWDALEWLPCRDGKARPTQPGLHPLAPGVSARVGRLRGYGNAIVPQVAAAFIEAYCGVTA